MALGVPILKHFRVYNSFLTALQFIKETYSLIVSLASDVIVPVQSSSRLDKRGYLMTLER